MAKYAIGYVLVILLGALVFFYGFGGGVVVEERFEGVGRPIPPEAFVEPQPVAPPEMIVLDDRGEIVIVLPPISYCWSIGNTSVCADGLPPLPGAEPTFASPIDLDFQMEWDDVFLTMRSEALECDSYTLSHDSVTRTTLDGLGPAGRYQVLVATNHRQGSASWVIAVEQESDTPLPSGVTC